MYYYCSCYKIFSINCKEPLNNTVQNYFRFRNDISH
jgi:hypothetical protein